MRQYKWIIIGAVSVFIATLTTDILIYVVNQDGTFIITILGALWVVCAVYAASIIADLRKMLAPRIETEPLKKDAFVYGLISPAFLFMVLLLKAIYGRK